MKQFFKFLFVVLFLLTTSEIISANDFTVKVKTTDKYHGLITPLKAGSKHQFQITVKNNRKDTCVVSINKNTMGEVQSWISIENNKFTIYPDKTVNFLLTINVPSDAGDRDYFLNLDFKGYDKNDNNDDFTFSHNYQTIIVDNSVPSSPTFFNRHTSTSIFVYSWNSTDDRSSEYTNANQSSGINGIKSYKVTLKKTGYTKSKTFKATDTDHYTFTNLPSNTNYKLSVTATDLAGNSKTKEITATTAPAKPTNLTFSKTTYISTRLSWSVCGGATGYNVYLFKNNKNTKLNSVPVLTNSYYINNLDLNTTYYFNVVALSKVGTSDRSSNKSVKTLALPHINGPSFLCSGNSTFSIDNLIEGFSISWSKSSNIRYVSGQGTNNYRVRAINSSASESGWVQANIHYADPIHIVQNIRSQVSSISIPIKKIFWIGKPSNFTITGSQELEPGAPGIAILDYSDNNSVSNVNWSYTGPLSNISGGIYNAKFRAGSSLGLGFIYALAKNTCGQIENRMFYEVKGGYYNIYPNPAKNILTVEIEHDKMSKEMQTKEVEIRLYDKLMIMKKHKVFKGNLIRLNLNDLKPDVYILQLKIGNEIFEEKIMHSY